MVEQPIRNRQVSGSSPLVGSIISEAYGSVDRNLLLNVFLLCGILIIFAGVAGLAFGGIRIFFNHILPEKVLHRQKDMDFISLNLSEGQDGASDSKVSPTIKAV